MRLDKFLKVSMILKRRSIANQACSGGRVDVNGKQAKPSHTIKEGDIVEVHFAQGVLKFRVLKLAQSAKKDEASKMYEVLS